MRFIALIILFAFSSNLSSQDKEWKLVQSLGQSVQHCKLDQLNNLYAVKKGEVLKFDDQGKEISRFSNKLIGEDVHLDVTNPLKILIYSPAQMKLITLDSRLGEMNDRINFFDRGYEQISLVATSHSNALWIYDPINFQLIRLTSKLEEESRSLNIAQHLRLEFYPTDVIEVNSKVYLTDPMHGVFEFDVFGNYLRKIPIKGIESLIVSDNRLFYEKDGVIEALNLVDSSLQLLKIEGSKKNNFFVNRNRVVITLPKKINIYQAKA